MAALARYTVEVVRYGAFWEEQVTGRCRSPKLVRACLVNATGEPGAC